MIIDFFFHSCEKCKSVLFMHNKVVTVIFSLAIASFVSLFFCLFPVSSSYLHYLIKNLGVGAFRGLARHVLTFSFGCYLVSWWCYLVSLWLWTHLPSEKSFHASSYNIIDSGTREKSFLPLLSSCSHKIICLWSLKNI